MKIKIGIQGDNESFVITPIDFSVTDIRGLEVYIKYLNGGYVDDKRKRVLTRDKRVVALFSELIQNGGAI